jgi:hypothetical protein|nr:MAG TPA: hypothetical protein [Caudoviricetes sp.]
MSGYRRRLAAIVNKQIFGVDFSKQPDNEIWYIPVDGQKLKYENFIGGWGKQQGLEVVSHIYENGIGKVVYNVDVKMLGESAFRVLNYNHKQALLISLPRKLYTMGAWALDSVTNELNSLVLLNGDFKGNILPSNKGHRPAISNVYVMQGCALYYVDMVEYNVIEKKI